VAEALEKARPYLRSHGGNVELAGIDDDGTVRLRLQGSCHGCPSSSMTLKLAIEEAIREAAPDVTAIRVEGEAPAVVPPSRPLVVLEGGPQADEVAWEEIEGLALLPDGGLGLYQAGERELLCCRVAGTLYAYGERCPACGDRLGDAALHQAALSCAGCGQSFDVVQAGRGIDRPELHLDPVPLFLESGRARVALAPVRVGAGS
jgi:Fe-S cluster biogenesis protein NfuA/nitrite reductase/ring-hydroxylating ferredoxin subunit